MILPLPHKYSIFVQFLSQCTFVPIVRCTGRRGCALGLIEYFNIVEKLSWLTLHFTAVSTEYPLVSASCTPFIFPSPPHPVSKSVKERDSVHSTFIWADVKKQVNTCFQCHWMYFSLSIYIAIREAIIFINADPPPLGSSSHNFWI